MSFTSFVIFCHSVYLIKFTMNTYHAACWSDDSYSSSDEEGSRYNNANWQATNQYYALDSIYRAEDLQCSVVEI